MTVLYHTVQKPAAVNQSLLNKLMDDIGDFPGLIARALHSTGNDDYESARAFAIKYILEPAMNEHPTVPVAEPCGYLCDACGETFSIKNGLVSHLKARHRNRFICPKKDCAEVVRLDQRNAHVHPAQ